MCGEAGPQDREDYPGGRDYRGPDGQPYYVPPAVATVTRAATVPSKAVSVKLFDGDTQADFRSEDGPTSIGNAFGLDFPSKKKAKKRTSVPGLGL